MSQMDFETDMDSMYDEFEDDDDYLEEEGEGSAFDPVVPEREQRKAYHVDFRVFSSLDISKKQQEEVKHVTNILGCSSETAGTLLRHFKWNKEQLVERYMEDPDGVAAASGVLIDQQTEQMLTVPPSDFVCEICYDDSPEQIFGVSCGHKFCADCYCNYLEQKIVGLGECRAIKCPAQRCSVVVGEQTIRLLMRPKPQVLAKFDLLLLRTYVDDSKYLKWCPAPNCDYAVECKATQLHEVVPTVTCTCGNVFCHGCSLPDHQPAPCDIVRLWLKKCADDSETSNWISANTKECTKCNTTIEKNGGCNHMTCRKCKYEFCWVCLGAWSDHGTAYYSCNRFDEKDSIEARTAQEKSRAALKRYLHYYNRYANHESSAKLGNEMFAKTELKMEQLQTTSELSWIEVQFMKKAAEVLLQSRMTLKWTYAFAYYLARNNMTELFEDNQRDLEMAVEQLSELLERTVEPHQIMQLKQQVIDKTVYVSSRREVLLEDTAKGLLDHRWSFDTSSQSTLPGTASSSGSFRQ